MSRVFLALTSNLHEQRLKTNLMSTLRIHVKFMKKLMVPLFFNHSLVAHISLFLSYSITQILEGDQILSVDGFETFGKPIKTVAEMFVGDEGSSVKLLMSRFGSQ